MNRFKFICLFLLFMGLTYVWRVLFVAAGFQHWASFTVLSIITNILMILTYAGLIYTSYQRYKSIGNKLLIYLPSLASIFDIIIVQVLFIPSLLNLITLYLGAKNKSSSLASARLFLNIFSR